MTSIKLAVISDLHIGSGSRAADLCPFEDKYSREPAYIDNFVNFVINRSLSADFLVIPGDISDRAHPLEYELAGKIIARIAEALHVPIENIVVTPGNHDVNWPISKSHEDDTTRFIRTLRFKPIENPNWLIGALLKDQVGSLTESPHFILKQYDKLLFVCYNSACEDDYDTKPHYGIARQSDLDEIRSRLENLSISNDLIKCFVVHHHPTPYSDPRPNQPDFSQMTNADNLRILLEDFKFDFLLHGHKHVPRFSVRIRDSGHPLAVLAAGSFSRSLDSTWTGRVHNQFHIIEVDDRDPATMHPRGQMRSWTYTTPDWIPSEQWAGIQHERPFGFTIALVALQNTLRTFFTSQPAGIAISIHNLFEAIPNLRYLFPERLIEALAPIILEFNFQCYYAVPNDIRSAILLPSGT